jgi:peroxiredoxin
MPSTTIAEQVNVLKAGSASRARSDVMSAFAREQAELAVRGMPDDLIKVGSTLPDASLLDPHGEPTSLYGALGGRPAVLIFYRGAWCPYCNIALRTYQTELLPELTMRGVGLVAISPQAPDGSLSMRDKNELRFTVLSDPGNDLANTVGVVTAPSSEARAAQLQFGLDLEAVNADGTTAIPMPTTLILDADCVVQWVDVHPDYTTRTEPTEILDILDALGTATQ